MTMQEFVAAAEALCPDQGRALFVGVDRRRYSGNIGTFLKWRIWDGDLNDEFQADTPGAALALYRAAVAPPTPASEALAAVGDIYPLTP